MGKISSTMNLSDLADLMGNNATDAEAAAMRDLINREAINYGWEETSDIEDTEWFAMMASALDPKEWVVIHDGTVMYPIRADDFAASSMTIKELREIDDPEVYADWCSGMRMPEFLSAGTRACIDACRDLEDRGARRIDISA